MGNYADWTEQVPLLNKGQGSKRPLLFGRGFFGLVINKFVHVPCAA